MKKLMFAAATAAALVGMADIESTNIVGYQTLAKATDNTGYQKNAFNVKASTFVNVGAGVAKLGDIQLVGSEYGGTDLQLLNGNGSTLKITEALVGKDAFDKFGATTYAQFCFLSAEEAGEEFTPGWYLNVDEDLEFPMNSVVFKKGQGFLMKPQEDVDVQFAGQVDIGEAGEIAVPYNKNEFNVVGNATPVALTLGDLVLNGSEYGGTDLQFLNGNGSTLKITEALVGKDAFDKFGATTYAQFCFLSAEEAGEDFTPGWYLNVDEDLEFPMNDVVIPAGQGFLMKPQETIDIVLPSPIK